jgi:hypothetical protein
MRANARKKFSAALKPCCAPAEGCCGAGRIPGPAGKTFEDSFAALRDVVAGIAEAAGVTTRHHHGAGLIHGYFGLGEASETARHEARRVRAHFKSLLNRA